MPKKEKLSKSQLRYCWLRFLAILCSLMISMACTDQPEDLAEFSRKSTEMPVSIDIDALETINSSNASYFPIKGTCSEEGREVTLHIEGVQTSTLCSNQAWNVTVDITHTNKKNLVNITVFHSAASGEKGEAFSSINNQFICDSHFIGVPAMSEYTTHSFCVAKYEMKSNQRGHTISHPKGLPRTKINRNDAADQCRTMGDGHDLITNDEWQTLARNIEQVPSNWEASTIGSPGGINQGHSGSFLPMDPLPASDNDSKGCFKTKEQCDGTLWSVKKRTHALSNGEVIWDLSGNVEEWVKDDNGERYGTSDYWSKITAKSHLRRSHLNRRSTNRSRLTKDQFGPYRDYSQHDAAPYAGLGYARIDFNGGAIVRGGYWRWGWLWGPASGIFAVNLSYPPSYASKKLGFRCVFHPRVL